VQAMKNIKEGREKKIWI